MSGGERIPLAEAAAMAEELVALLAPACERIEIAGSIRRRRAHVADIELVAVPRVDRQPSSLWGDTAPLDRLAERIVELRGDDRLVRRSVEIRRVDGTVEYSPRDGSAYKALWFRNFPVDLFIVREPAVSWGVILALRTGPGDWNRRLVEDCKRYFRRVDGGRVLHLGQVVPCPEEWDFFRAIGQPWLAPGDRGVDRVHIVPPEQLAEAAR